MDTDLDDLLEEVENKFLKGAEKGGYRKRVEKIPSFGDDGLPPLDEILREVSDSAPTERPVEPKADPVKCFPVYVSGADVACGLSTATRPRSCSQLHCTSCDFRVQIFEGLRWRDDTDYLFLRTNMPHFYRLQEKLRTAAGWRAYACQCRHYSTRQLEQLQRISDLNWVCRGH